MRALPRRVVGLALQPTALLTVLALFSLALGVSRVTSRSPDYLLTAGSDFTITSTISSSPSVETPALLYPGVARYLWYTVHNSKATPITVKTLTTQLASPVPATCPASNLDLTQTGFMGSLTVPAAIGTTDGVSSVSVPIMLINSASNQDGCKNATFQFTFSGTAEYNQTFNTTTGLTTSLNPSLAGQSVTFTATVASVGTPPGPLTGSVTFKDGSTVLAANVGLLSGHASHSTSALTAGSHSITAVYNPSTLPADAGNFATSTSPIVTQVVFTSCITGTVSGGITVSNGQSICIVSSGRVNGGVTVQSGGALTVLGGTVNGEVSIQTGGRLTVTGGVVNSIRSTGSLAVRVCGATIKGDLSVQGSTGPVIIGDISGCTPNTVSGNATIADNTSGFKVVRNSLAKSLTVTANTSSAPAIDNARISGNQIKASLSCSGNNPAPANGGQANSVKGSRSGQCTGSF